MMSFLFEKTKPLKLCCYCSACISQLIHFARPMAAGLSEIECTGQVIAQAEFFFAYVGVTRKMPYHLYYTVLQEYISRCYIRI